MQQFDATNNPADATRKPVMEIKKPCLEMIDKKFYWIAGQEEVFLLNNGNTFAYKMSPEEIGEMSVELVYAGQGNPIQFVVEEKRAFEIILQIIHKMNLMQTSKIYSFPLGWFE